MNPESVQSFIMRAPVEMRRIRLGLPPLPRRQEQKLPLPSFLPWPSYTTCSSAAPCATLREASGQRNRTAV